MISLKLLFDVDFEIGGDEFDGGGGGGSNSTFPKMNGPIIFESESSNDASLWVKLYKNNMICFNMILLFTGIS